MIFNPKPNMSQPDSKEKSLPADFVKFLQKSKDSLTFQCSSKLDDKTCDKILESYAKVIGITNGDDPKRIALVGISILFQKGGTTRACDSNLCAKFNNYDFKLGSFRKVLNDLKLSKSERKFARNLGTKIGLIAVELDLPGNLSKKIPILNPYIEFSRTELAWMSDFQRDNPDCPEKIRSLIISTLNKRRENTQPNNKTKNNYKNNPN
jgi:hypothetical protein